MDEEVRRLREENAGLRLEVERLADVVAHCAELMVELEESRRREDVLVREEEELMLQTAVDSAIMDAHDPAGLAEQLVAVLVTHASLGASGGGVIVVAGTPPIAVRSGDPSDELVTIALARVAGDLSPAAVPVVPIVAAHRVLGVMVLGVPPDEAWSARWGPRLASIGRQVGQAFRRQMAELETIRANAELAIARDRALEGSIAKSRFLATMSHELRTPLNAILGYTEIVREDLDKDEHAQSHIDLEHVLGSGRHLLEMIDAVLDLSKIEAGRMDVLLEYVATLEIVEEAVAIVRPAMARNRNELIVELPARAPGLNANARLVRQCLINLLGNAAKFTHNGRVTLRVRHDEPLDRVLFEVVDTGIGLSPEQIGRIFQPFMQADSSTTRKYGGTGLGLALTVAFVRQMAGSVDVESSLGAGSTFRLVMPAHERDKMRVVA
jgi:signal transduction histidine kinase